MVVVSPGPKYRLPRLLGCKRHDLTKYQNPCYSFGYRVPFIDFTNSPGPKYKIDHNVRKKYRIVTRIGLNQAPAYSLRDPLKDLKLDTGPGPKYSFKRNYITQQWAPKYSLRPQTADVLVDTSSPGPHYKYDRKLNKIFLRQPEYSMGQRCGVDCPDDSPGPAKYPCCGKGLNMNLVARRAPKYTMASRAIPPGYRGTIPAPNRYTVTVTPKYRRSPKYSFGTRHADFAEPMIVECDN